MAPSPPVLCSRLLLLLFVPSKLLHNIKRLSTQVKFGSSHHHHHHHRLFRFNPSQSAFGLRLLLPSYAFALLYSLPFSPAHQPRVVSLLHLRAVLRWSPLRVRLGIPATATDRPKGRHLYMRSRVWAMLPYKVDQVFRRLSLFLPRRGLIGACAGVLEEEVWRISC